MPDVRHVDAKNKWVELNDPNDTQKSSVGRHLVSNGVENVLSPLKRERRLPANNLDQREVRLTSKSTTWLEIKLCFLSVLKFFSLSPKSFNLENEIKNLRNALIQCYEEQAETCVKKADGCSHGQGSERVKLLAEAVDMRSKALAHGREVGADATAQQREYLRSLRLASWGALNLCDISNPFKTKAAMLTLGLSMVAEYGEALRNLEKEISEPEQGKGAEQCEEKRKLWQDEYQHFTAVAERIMRTYENANKSWQDGAYGQNKTLVGCILNLNIQKMKTELATLSQT